MHITTGAIAKAPVTLPKLVLTDEPTANLDHETAYKVIGLMHNMKEEFNIAFIFATHGPKIVGEAERCPYIGNLIRNN